MASTGVACTCEPNRPVEQPLEQLVEQLVEQADEPPAKRRRGRPPRQREGNDGRDALDGCRACWRSLAADRPQLPPPHDLSLATRCLHEHSSCGFSL